MVFVFALPLVDLSFPGNRLSRRERGFLTTCLCLR